MIRLGIAAATLLAWALLVWLLAAPAPTTQDIYAGIPFDAHLIGTDREALEAAYKERVVKLFGVWLTNTQAKEAAQFTAGLLIARRGYNTALQQIERREREHQQLQQGQPK